MTDLRPASLILAAALAACGSAPSACQAPHRNAPYDVADDDPAKQAAACHDAGNRLAELHCPEWRKDWDDFCTETMDAGVPLHPVCLASITDCRQVDESCR